MGIRYIALAPDLENVWGTTVAVAPRLEVSLPVIHVGTGLTRADFKDKGTATVQGAQCPFTTRGDAVDSRTTSLPASVIRLSGFLPESSSSRI